MDAVLIGFLAYANVGSVRYQEARNVHEAMHRGVVQGRRPSVVERIYVRTVLQEERGDISEALYRRVVERGTAMLVWAVDCGASLEKHLGDPDIVGVDCLV